MNLPEQATNYLDVAVIAPCLNEAATIAQVVSDFLRALPGCRVYVYDNASTDRTAERAREAGATVRFEPVPGKGGVLRRMFAEIDARVYVIVDGDSTYDATRAPELVAAIALEGFDMMTAVRDNAGDTEVYRRGHRFANRMFNWLLGVFFGQRPKDMFSGYRALSRRFVKSFPSTARGFEIETELTVHALQMRVPCGEIVTRYFARPRGSASKLRSYRDGIRILAFMGFLFRDVRPFAFFGIIGVVLLVAAFAFGSPVIIEYERTGLVPRLPTAVLATGLVLLSSLSIVCGLILDSVSRGRLEAKRLAYLAVSARFMPAAPDLGKESVRADKAQTEPATRC
jgi:glycosyltransferase involved in cell wall biosynthesis